MECNCIENVVVTQLVKKFCPLGNPGVPLVVIVDKLHWIFVVRADKIKPLFTPKV
jgi:hypothetical protein